MARSLKVLLGVSGGIAAVKSPELVRSLRRNGHEVRCALSPHASAFVAPLALEVLSGAPVRCEEYLEPTGSGREEHIELGRWPDVFCVAPATCHTLACLALGLADNFLTTTALVYNGPVIVAPAMSSEMWAKGVVQQHIRTLEDRGVQRVGPVHGALAIGEIGEGRMAEPQEIVAAIEGLFRPEDLGGRTVLITAGPTREAIDPVRFLANRSTGKMGYSLASAARERGARVLLVSGPVEMPTPHRVQRFDVESAREMESRVRELAPAADLIIMTAAVADFRPHSVSQEKIKKQDGGLTLVLEENPDILSGLAAVASGALRVGFAAETENIEAEAERKLLAKEAHFMVANDVSRSDIGFGSDQNEVTVFTRDRAPIRIPIQGKKDIAHALLDIFADTLNRREVDVLSADS